MVQNCVFLSLMFSPDVDALLSHVLLGNNRAFLFPGRGQGPKLLSLILTVSVTLSIRASRKSLVSYCLWKRYGCLELGLNGMEARWFRPCSRGLCVDTEWLMGIWGLREGPGMQRKSEGEQRSRRTMHGGWQMSTHKVGVLRTTRTGPESPMGPGAQFKAKAIILHQNPRGTHPGRVSLIDCSLGPANRGSLESWTVWGGAPRGGELVCASSSSGSPALHYF